ncbi:FAD-binding oxidoreductase [Ureibacillus thermophilus]|uniref:D-lactate dehydrogenase (cytochrome) n=1 Tax=Ureibacillus thermophilus TaxID=367743 RepID=A0A4P6USG2_9BACL|nr:FAD-linked oxidase C-terminal domain-containing protein [Ureibacillus thermophilus]QBK26053.1 FAD-binding protein [Ureibacillus thermophilus]
MKNYKEIEQRLLTFLSKEQVTTNETVRQLHGQDESYHTPALPDLVVFPRSTEEVSKILKIANEYEVPVTPFGAGSSLEGHVIPYEGGISIDFNEMNQILEIDPESFIVRVQPGVRRVQLNKELKKYGLFFSVDPGADATLGGMAATNASGTTAVKYGVMRDQVLDLEVVLANGDIIHTGNKARKSSSGLHLNGLFVGSEGILGCITELTLKVYGIPEFEVAGRAVFKSTHEAVQAVTALKQAGIPIGRVELVDAESIQVVNKHSETNYAEAPTLFLEFQGNEAGLQSDIEFAKEVLKEFDCEDIQFEKDTAARNTLWHARHNLAYAYKHAFPGRKLMTTDVCVPINELANSIEYARSLLEELKIHGGLLGHVGDGNYHACIMIDLNDEEEVARAKKFNEMIVTDAIKRGGTCTGEHGVGVGKRMYQELEHRNALEVMRAIKKALDPKGILNPGKIL